MDIHIEKLENIPLHDKGRIKDLMGQLSDKFINNPLIETNIENIHNCSTSTLIVARDCNEIVGMITMSIYDALSGRKAWIEDFVVDCKYRGTGIADLLFHRAIDEAKKNQVDIIYLTSGSSRLRAHAFYDKMGMKKRDTSVYEMKIKSLR